MSFFIDFHDENSEFMWGLLIAAWTKGTWPEELSHLDPADLKVPTTLDELRSQIQLVGIKVTVPDVYTKLSVVSEDPQTLVVRLPAKAHLVTAENGIKDGSLRYSVPHFYETFMGPLVAESTQDKLKFQKCRIGDYAIATCM